MNIFRPKTCYNSIVQQNQLQTFFIILHFTHIFRTTTKNHHSTQSHNQRFANKPYYPSSFHPPLNIYISRPTSKHEAQSTCWSPSGITPNHQNAITAFIPTYLSHYIYLYLNNNNNNNGCRRWHRVVIYHFRLMA